MASLSRRELEDLAREILEWLGDPDRVRNVDHGVGEGALQFQNYVEEYTPASERELMRVIGDWLEAQAA